MKYCKECWVLNQNVMLKYCMDHADMNKGLKTYKPLQPWPPPKKFWKKRTERVKEKWSEWKVFVEIWLERLNWDWKRICDNCKTHIQLFDPSCFAHKLNKRDHPDLRYKKDNIALVHWIWEQMDETWKTYNCHKEYDLKFKKQLWKH